MTNNDQSDRQPGQKYLTIQQAADVLHVSAQTVRRRISEGRLVAFRVGVGTRSSIRVRQTDIEQMLFQIPTVEPPTDRMRPRRRR